MDIPETGAVFAFGRSHLTISGDGNDNNYFFVKKDRIKRLICGQNQSAVICESGRLFVWGENPCGQLGIGTCENIVTKPSCVKVIKKLGHTVKDFQYGSNFSVLLTDSSKIFYAGKNIFPFNAKIDSLDGVFQHDITEVPIELREYEQFGEQFDMIRAGDEHIVVMNRKRDKLFGWGFNSHYQLAQIDSTAVLKQPDVFFQADEGETIKLLECGKISTCMVTEFNDLYMTGRYKTMTISSFTKIREPIPNSTITQVCISDEDDVYLLTENGVVYKSSANMKNVDDIKFEEVTFPELNDKIAKMAPGVSFLSIITRNGRCFSLLDDDKTALIESGKLRDLNVVDINAGAQHVLVATVLRSEDENGNDDPQLNQTYTISFKKITEMGSGVDNYQEPDTGEQIKSLARIDGLTRGARGEEEDKNDNVSVIELEESIRGGNGSRATTLECKDTESSNHSSAHKDSERPNSTIRFIDNGIEKNAAECNAKNGSVKIRVNDTSDDNEEEEEDYDDDNDEKKIPRKKTPMPRARKTKIITEDDLDENGIIDRDEDLYDDNDDVSTSTLRGSEESLEAYIQEENKINEFNKSNGRVIGNERFRRVKKFMSDMKDKGKGLSCRNADNVIDDTSPPPPPAPATATEANNLSRDNHKKSCAIM